MYAQLLLLPALVSAPHPVAAPAPAPVVAPVAAQASGTPLPGNIVEVAAANGNFTILGAALQATGLDVALDGSQTSERFTVFAPTDAAFAALPAGATVPELLNDLPRLADILLYHVAPGGLLSGSVIGSPTIQTLNGQRLDVSTSGGNFFLDQSQLVITDILTTNGVIHVIDRVLIPNEASIVEVAAGAPDAVYLSHILAFLPTLEQTLGTDQFTVFAPTNAAFQQFPATTLRSLVSPSGLPTLEGILLVHAVPGRFYADELLGLGQVTSVGGKVLQVQQVGANVVVDTANVVVADIDVGNGNIHFIDMVLMP